MSRAAEVCRVLYVWRDTKCITTQTFEDHLDALAHVELVVRDALSV